jgi:hypothetical protein
MPDKHPHQAEVAAFIQAHIARGPWTFDYPQGSGQETYFAGGGGQAYFIKLGAAIERAQAMAVAELSPPVLAAGRLADGTPILVQPRIAGRTPGKRDFQEHLEQVATMLRRMHQDAGVRAVLPPPPSERLDEAGLRRLGAVRRRWEAYKAQVPAVAAFVEAALDRLAAEMAEFVGTGLVAAHNDICNANWLLTPQGRLYLVDLDAMALDDPAADVGALLWWYYPPALRPRFLRIAGIAGDPAFPARMNVRMALHCLSITLPRAGSYDGFDPAGYPAALTDFRAILAGEENPQGYGISE